MIFAHAVWPGVQLDGVAGSGARERGREGALWLDGVRPRCGQWASGARGARTCEDGKRRDTGVPARECACYMPVREEDRGRAHATAVSAGASRRRRPLRACVRASGGACVCAPQAGWHLQGGGGAGEEKSGVGTACYRQVKREVHPSRHLTDHADVVLLLNTARCRSASGSPRPPLPSPLLLSHPFASLLRVCVSCCGLYGRDAVPRFI